MVECLNVIRDRFKAFRVFRQDIKAEFVLMESDLQEQTKHKSTHEFLKVELFLFFGHIREQANEYIEPVVKGLRNVSFKVPLAKSSCCCLALELPFVAVNNKDSGSVKWSEDVTNEFATYVVLAIVLLDMFKIGGVINDVQAKERYCHLISRPVSFVERVPGLAAGSAIGFEFLGIPFKWLPLRPGNELRVCRR